LLAWAGAYLGQEAWWDEIVSLKTFALAGFETTVTHYAGTHGNHHTFYNLANNLYTWAAGLRNLDAAIDGIHWLRLLQLVFAIGTVVLAFSTATRFLGRASGFVSGMILVTTVPFLNFALQLRGYSLSMLLTVAVLCCFWDYRRTQRPSRAVLLTVLSFLLLYTMPGNAYFVLSLIAIAAARLLLRAAKQGLTRSTLLRDPNAIQLVALAAGILLFLAAYSPLLDDFLRSRFATARPPVRTYALTSLLPEVLQAFISFRYALLPLFAIGMLQLLRRRRPCGNLQGAAGGPVLQGAERISELAALLLLPFLISLVRGDWPPDRTFVFLAPIWSLLLGAGIGSLPPAIRTVERHRLLWGVTLFAYCTGSLLFAYHHVQNQLTDNLHKSVRSQNMLYNYYLSRAFRPSRDLAPLIVEVSGHPAPILLVDEVDRVALGTHLERHALGYYALVSVREGEEDGAFAYTCLMLRSERGQAPATRAVTLLFRAPLAPECRAFSLLYGYLVREGVISSAAPSFYLVTSFPETAEKLEGNCGHDLEAANLSGRPSYTNVFRVTGRSR